MRYKLFGRSGLRVSELCLGAMTFGESWGGANFGWSDGRDAAKAIFDAYANAGGNFIDTADMYADGESERRVGEFIASDRDHFVVATKYSMNMEGDIAKSGNSRRHMLRSVERSLKRLNTDRIDLYLLHAWDYTTPVDEIMRAFDDLVRAGKVQYIAISDAPAWRISEANMLATLRGWTAFSGIQLEYNLTERTAERDLLPMARVHDLAVMIWAPLAAGVLSGKYRAQPGKGRQVGRPIPERSLQIGDLVCAIAAECGASPSQVALAFLRQQSERYGTLIPIVGARTVEQLADNIGCLNLTLSPEHMAKLDAATAIQMGFPHDMLAMDFIRGVTHGMQVQRLDNNRPEAAARRIGGNTNGQ
ncbi:MAG: aldo/keto reductase [Hyphomonadaceae bacterium]